MQKGKKTGKGKGNRPPKNMPNKQVKEFVQLKNRMLKELTQLTKARNSRQQTKLSQRPKRQSKYQNLSGVKGTRQNQGFGNKKRIIVKETEYIGEVTVANQPNFKNLYTLPCNPGQSSTFPWLYTIAKNYEKYRFLELCFFFKPEVTEFTANVNTGKVILSADYDASDAPPASKQQMEDVDPHADGMPYQSIMLTLDPKQMFQQSDARFVRIGGLPGSTDIKTYDCANFFLAVSGQTANSTIGELHVRYTVELSVPVIEDVAMAPTNNQVSLFQSTGLGTTGETIATTGVAQNLAFGSTVTNGCNIVNTAGSFVPPAGNYLVDVVAVYENTSDDTVYADFDIFVAGATATNGFIVYQGVVTGGNKMEYMTLNQNYFLSLNGAQAVTIPTTVSFSGGTQICFGQIRFTAI